MLKYRSSHFHQGIYLVVLFMVAAGYLLITRRPYAVYESNRNGASKIVFRPLAVHSRTLVLVQQISRLPVSIH